MTPWRGGHMTVRSAPQDPALGPDPHKGPLGRPSQEDMGLRLTSPSAEDPPFLGTHRGGG